MRPRVALAIARRQGLNRRLLFDDWARLLFTRYAVRYDAPSKVALGLSCRGNTGPSVRSEWQGLG
ncbi:MAG TPA: hypothetical protein VMV40_08840 [Acidiferrobacter sp.]|nr:hypothetical protein [Acidiferrobacter sp.]